MRFGGIDLRQTDAGLFVFGFEYRDGVPVRDPDPRPEIVSAIEDMDQVKESSPSKVDKVFFTASPVAK
jgi:hypothetical protein